MSDIQVIQHDYSGYGSGWIPAKDLHRKADLIFGDPPYNYKVKYADDPTGDNLTLEQYQKTTLDAFAILLGAARPGATFWWMTPEEHGDWTGDLLTRVVGPRLYRIVWEESFSQYQGDRALTKDYRFIFCHRVGSVGGEVTFNPNAIRIPSVRQEMGDKRANPLGRVPGCVWKFRRLQGTSKDHVDWHPCQLPPELLMRIVYGWSNPGDLVLDAYGGSGSMGKVCKTLGRRAVLVDRSPTYCAKMREELLTCEDRHGAT